jgi:L-fuconolactonase
VALRIDAHHHFWDPARYSYPWMAGDAMDPVRRAFAPDDLRGPLAEEQIDGTVLVQTLASPPETREFLHLAAATGFVQGVVGWVDLTSPGAADDLDALLDGPAGRWLAGIRHQVHDEPDPDWLARADVHRGLAAVQARGLTYDLLIRARELPAAVDTVREFPGLQFVLDHIAKPRIADGRDDPWSQRLPALAAQPNVAVKLSGMITEADWATWSPDDLRPFVGQVVEWFGVPRLMFGSDWPVCLLAGSYHAVLGGLIEAMPALSPAELDQVLGTNAQRVYQLGKHTAPAPDTATLRRCGGLPSSPRPLVPSSPRPRPTSWLVHSRGPMPMVGPFTGLRSARRPSASGFLALPIPGPASGSGLSSKLARSRFAGWFVRDSGRCPIRWCREGGFASASRR